MKRAITTLLLVLALVGCFGLTTSFAVTARTFTAPCCAPVYTDFIGAPGSCPTMDTHCAKVTGRHGLLVITYRKAGDQSSG
ncbi:exported hypothetical protein [Syntrophobacter sp. SbD1]|nr:exported hypothetical protein [Syntrophobacter sp. SbD1]